MYIVMVHPITIVGMISRSTSERSTTVKLNATDF